MLDLSAQGGRYPKNARRNAFWGAMRNTIAGVPETTRPTLCNPTEIGGPWCTRAPPRPLEAPSLR
eukprot:8094833-Alexandrium_andersonii.AAC.1